MRLTTEFHRVNTHGVTQSFKYSAQLRVAFKSVLLRGKKLSTKAFPIFFLILATLMLLSCNRQKKEELFLSFEYGMTYDEYKQALKDEVENGGLRKHSQYDWYYFDFPVNENERVKYITYFIEPRFSGENYNVIGVYSGFLVSIDLTLLDNDQEGQRSEQAFNRYALLDSLKSKYGTPEVDSTNRRYRWNDRNRVIEAGLMQVVFTTLTEMQRQHVLKSKAREEERNQKVYDSLMNVRAQQAL